MSTSGRVPAPYLPQSACTPVPLLSTGVRYSWARKSQVLQKSLQSSCARPRPRVPRSGDSCFGYPVPAHHSLCCWCSGFPELFPESLEAIPALPPSSCPDDRSFPNLAKSLSRPLRPLGSHLSPAGSLRSSPDPRCPLPEAAPGAGLHR